MKIVVIGGSGLIGTKLVEKLRKAGHEALPASPASGVNTLTGEGLTEAMRGADVLVDVANSPSFEDAAVLAFFQTSTKNLLAAAKAEGVKHYIALSVVGADRMPSIGYMRAKIAQEQAIARGEVPYTILRATQFFEFIGKLADGATRGTEAHLSAILMQPLAADDVASALADIAAARPVDGMREVAGPEAIRLDELARRLFAAKKDPRQVVTDVRAGYFGSTDVDDRSLTPGADPRLGAIRFADWLHAG